MQIIEEEEKKVDVCYPAMLKHWVEQATPTWYTLVEALESKVMGRSDIAGNIQSQYNVVNQPSGKGSHLCSQVWQVFIVCVRLLFTLWISCRRLYCERGEKGYVGSS